jgi:hypothetical protein
MSNGRISPLDTYRIKNYQRRTSMANTKLDRERQAIDDAERIRKKAKTAARKERAIDSIVVVERGNIAAAVAVAVIRNRAVHILSHCSGVRDELATYRGQDITAAEAALTLMENGANADLDNFPTGWTNK